MGCTDHNLLLDILNTFNVADWATLNLSFMSIEFY